MGMPNDVGIVDTMIGFPHADMAGVYDFITRRKNSDPRGREDIKAHGSRLRREGHFRIAHSSLGCDQKRSRSRFASSGDDVVAWL